MRFSSFVFPNAGSLAFMTSRMMKLDGTDCLVSRSGYTGEDGFEIAIASDKVGDLWQRLLVDERVKPIGLGARDSLRLEAGLCLYGHDIDETTSPVEAGLAWSIQKRRRLEGGFPGAERILRELRDGPSRLRVGIRPDGRAPAREGTEILSVAGEPVGRITSGGFGPSLDAPIAMGYVNADHAVRARSCGSWCVASHCRPTSCDCRSSRTATSGQREAGINDWPNEEDRMASERYSKDHEWVREAAGVATVGITAHAAEQLGDVVFVELPEIGRKVVAGEAVAVVESVKAASDVYAPVSGEVIEVNAELPGNPAWVNEDPGGKAWFFKVRMTNSAELGSLLSAEDYEKLIGKK